MPEQIGNSKGNSVNGKPAKDRRRAECQLRKSQYDALSLVEKLDRLPKDGANRQRARLTQQIAAQQNSAANKQAQKKERTQKAAEKLVSQSHDAQAAGNKQ